jgi:hypothetical protein
MQTKLKNVSFAKHAKNEKLFNMDWHRTTQDAKWQAWKCNGQSLLSIINVSPKNLVHIGLKCPNKLIYVINTH